MPSNKCQSCWVILVLISFVIAATQAAGIFELHVIKQTALDLSEDVEQLAGDSKVQLVPSLSLCLTSTSLTNSPVTVYNQQCPLGQTYSINTRAQPVLQIPFSFRWQAHFSMRLRLAMVQLASAGNSTAGTSTNQTLVGEHHIETFAEANGEQLLPTNGQDTYFFKTLRSSRWLLAVRFRVRCSENYYADGCHVFCRPRDDLTGHWTCNQRGERVCMSGWTGPSCSKARCAPGCSARHGFCDEPNTCLCRPGYSGPQCSTPICFPGCLHGYCVKPWQCLCTRDWGGLLCDVHLNPCKHQPCGPHSLCLPSSSNSRGFVCNCTQGWTGPECDRQIDPDGESIASLFPDYDPVRPGPLFGGGHKKDQPKLIGTDKSQSDQIEFQEVDLKVHLDKLMKRHHICFAHPVVASIIALLSVILTCLLVVLLCPRLRRCLAQVWARIWPTKKVLNTEVYDIEVRENCRNLRLERSKRSVSIAVIDNIAKSNQFTNNLNIGIVRPSHSVSNNLNKLESSCKVELDPEPKCPKADFEEFEKLPKGKDLD